VSDNEDISATGADPTSELIVTFVHKARALFVAGGVVVTLEAVLDLAVATIEGCDCAGIFVLEGGRVTTPVQTDPLVVELEASQLRTGTGPCLEAIDQGLPIYAEDLAVDLRWPAFASEAVAIGVRSVLALRLAADGTIGALSLYARYPSAFGAVDRAKGLVLAGLAGIALSLAQARDEDVRQAENLRNALVTRELVGQAQGILMERERITAEQAFDILRRASQHLNIKLREVAQDVVDTGERPETGVPRSAPPAP
jgi:GAF domain-containing protein